MKKTINRFSAAKSIFENGLPNITQKNLNLLSVYLRNKLLFGDKKIEDCLIQYCKNFEEEFNVIISGDKILRAVRYSKKSTIPLTDFSNIDIYTEWLENTKKIKDFKAQVIFLTMIIYSKIFHPKGKNLIFYENELSDILEMSGIKMTVKTFSEKYYFLLKSNNLVEHKPMKDFVFLKIDKFPLGEISFTISDIKNIKKQYVEYLGGEIFYCKSCKKEYKKKGLSQVYCKECSSERRKEKERDRQRGTNYCV